MKTRIWTSSIVAGLALMCGFPSRAATTTNYKAVLTFTNAAGTANGDTVTVNGLLRRYTNGVPVSLESWIQATNNAGWSSTNTWLQFQAHALPAIYYIERANTNAIRLWGKNDTNLVVTFSTGVGTVTYETNILGDQYPLNLPIALEPGGIDVQIEQVSLLIAELSSSLPTNKVNALAAAWTNFVNLYAAQTLSNKTFYGSTNISGNLSNSIVQGGTIQTLAELRDVFGAEGVFILQVRGSGGTNYVAVTELGGLALASDAAGLIPKTNSTPELGELLNYTSLRGLFPVYLPGFTNWWASQNDWTNAATRYVFHLGFISTNGFLYKPGLSNAVHIGSVPFQSYNSDNTTLQLGRAAAASGLGSQAIGDSPTATGTGALAAGQTPDATGAYSTALGYDPQATANYASAFGAYGTSSNEHSVAIHGYTTRSWQIRLGTNHLVSIPGVLEAASTTNLNAVGSNFIAGALGFARRTDSSQPVGHNIITNAFSDSLVWLTAPSGGCTNVGLTDGWPGREIRYVKYNGGYPMGIANESGLASAERRILTGTGADLVLTNNPGFFRAQYDGTLSRWIIVEHSN